MKQAVNSWDSYIDRFTSSYWHGAMAYANKQVSFLSEALKKNVGKNDIDRQLIQAFYRISDFYCFERQYAKGEALLSMVLEAQKSVLAESKDTGLAETASRLERLRYVWECERSADTSFDKLSKFVFLLNKKSA